MKRIACWGAVIAAVSGGAGCSRPATEAFFPLTVGSSWTYELVTEMPNPPVDSKLVMSVDRAIKFDGKDVVVRRSASGVEYYLEQNKDGIRRLASRTDLEEDALLDEHPRTVLPEPPLVGAEWEAMTVPFLLQRNAEFPRELKYRHKTMMRYRIEAEHETVEVPAGKFTDCLRVKGQTSFKIFKDPQQGFSDQPLISTEWYCKGVGLVRFDRDEQVNSNFLTGGKIRYQLVDYDL